MKKYIAITGFFLLGWLLSSAQSEFITLWKPGTGNPQTIMFPGWGSNYTIQWEETGYPEHHGSVSNMTVPNGIELGNAYNPTPTNASYLVKVTGGLNRFEASTGNATSLLEIKQWGYTAWTTMNSAFASAVNLQLTATDAPNLSAVTDMFKMFSGCTAFTGNASMNTWHTDNVTNMEWMFYGASSFNQNISSWNTSKVTSMYVMFGDARSFNQNIAYNPNTGSWNTGNVSNMRNMFTNAIAFNQDISNWNTGKVTNMMQMFANAIIFNQPIGNWNTGNVTNMQQMFSGAAAFNQPIGNWNTAKVTNMSNMFTNASAFNQNIAYNPVTGSWNTGSVTDMSGMFAGARSFNQPIGNWNTAKVTDMSSMFSGARSFNQPLDWYTVGVESMQEMFKNASAFNQNIGSWHLGSIAYNLSMQSMLDGSGMDCSNYAKTIAGWWLGATNGQTGINLGASGLSYTGTTAKTAHDFFVNVRGWVITGDRYDPDCVPNPAVTGVTDIVTQVWLSETQPPLFVKRHYQITPQNDPEHAAGRVTLYFSNQDFKDFNNQNPVPAKLLPDADEQATIDERKSNLRIEKRSGTSTDASGLPGSYTGAVLTINPNDEDIVWNSSTSLWEVSFDVTGFSGFFIKTTESTLPVTFGDLSAIFKNNQLYINWATLSETGNSHFEIEASKDGKTFTKIATVSSKAAGGNSENPVSYEWVATTPNTGIMLGLSAFVMGLSLLAFGRKRKVVYMAAVLITCSITSLMACQKYNSENELDNHSKLFIRIKQVDKDGKAEYSKTVQVVKE